MMSRIEELIKEKCPGGVQYVRLNTICDVYDGTHSTPKYINQGIRFVSVENIGSIYASEKYISQEDYSKFKITPQINDVFMTRIGSIGVCTVVDREEPLAYYVSLALLRPDKEVINSHFLKYAIESFEGKKELYKRTLVNAVPIKVNKDDIGKILIPVPPIEVQEEIVRILDKFTELEAELQTELDARKKQYEYYRDKLMTYREGTSIIKLGKLCDIKGRIGFRGYTHDDFVQQGEGAITLSPGNIYNNHIIYDYCKYITWEKYEESPEIMLDTKDVVVCKTGSTVGKVAVVDYLPEKTTLNPQLVVLKNIKCNYRYLFYQITSAKVQRKIKGLAGVGSVPNISQSALGDIDIEIPSIEEQDKIVNILDAFDVICNDYENGLPAEIAARHKQYEYYRDKLLTFERKVV